jgi:peptidylprolyl isomerase
VRRVVVLLGTLALLLVGLTACGSDDGAKNTGKVTVSGDFGKKPKVTYDGELNRTTTEAKVLSKGSGPEIGEGGSAMVHLYIGNGYTGEQALSSWDQKTPQVITLNKDSLPSLRKAIAGHPAGSRVQVLSTPKDAFGENGNPDLYIGNGDSVVFVVDILSDVAEAPEGSGKPVPSRLPQFEEKDGKVTKLDFSKAARPPKRLKVVTVVEGDGPAVEKGDFTALRYVGQTYDGKKPFDETYSAEAITPLQIGVGGVIPGWDKGLIGVKQGSRVLLIAPPKEGYGKAGRGKEIQGDDTLVFVIDVLGVS